MRECLVRPYCFSSQLRRPGGRSRYEGKGDDFSFSKSNCC